MSVKLSGVTHAYRKKTVLDNITLEINDGDVLGIVGPNGAGKSTLLSILATLIKGDQGDVAYDFSSNQLKDLREHIAYVPQDIALFEEMTVGENLKVFCAVKTIEKETWDEVIQVMKLEDLLDEKVRKLSGGMKRRVNMAVSLLRDVKLILMDEPVVGVEYFIRKEIEDYIKTLSKKGKIIVMTSHMKEFLDNTCNKLLFLVDGQVKYYGDYDANLEYFR